MLSYLGVTLHVDMHDFHRSFVGYCVIPTINYCPFSVFSGHKYSSHLKRKLHPLYWPYQLTFVGCYPPLTHTIFNDPFWAADLCKQFLVVLSTVTVFNKGILMIPKQLYPRSETILFNNLLGKLFQNTTLYSFLSNFCQ